MSDLEHKLATARRDDWATMSPYIQQLLNDGAAATSSTALVDAAQKQIQRTALGVDEGMNDRQLSRAGTNLTSSQRLAMTGLNSVDAAANNTANINTARINQYESNVGALNRLIASTNAMKNNSASTLDGIAGNESQRRMAEANNKAAAKQSNIQTGIGLAGLGIMAAMAF